MTEAKIEVNEIQPGEEQIVNPLKIHICSHHNPKNWMNGEYVDNQDGTVTCKICPWGTRLPGYTRCVNERIIDLRTINRS